LLRGLTISVYSASASLALSGERTKTIWNMVIFSDDVVAVLEFVEELSMDVPRWRWMLPLFSSKESGMWVKS